VISWRRRIAIMVRIEDVRARTLALIEAVAERIAGEVP
jgi:hypothetical protein